MSDTGEAGRVRERGISGRPRPLNDLERRIPGAASVSRRWWEERARVDPKPLIAAVGPQSAWRVGDVPPPPLPPPLWNSAPASPAEDAKTLRIERLEQELAAAREEATAMHEMLEDLPEIFERKFRQRVHGILEQQQMLLADNRMLREQLLALQLAPGAPGSGSPRLLPPAAVSDNTASADRPPLRRVIGGMGRRLGQRLRSIRLGKRSNPDDPVSGRDDGRPRAA